MCQVAPIPIAMLLAQPLTMPTDHTEALAESLPSSCAPLGLDKSLVLSSLIPDELVLSHVGLLATDTSLDVRGWDRTLP